MSKGSHLLTNMSKCGIQKTELVATYLKTMVIAELHGKTEGVPIPDWGMEWSKLELVEDCNFAAKMLVEASRNQSEELP